MIHDFIPGAVPPADLSGPALWCLFSQDKILVLEEPGGDGHLLPRIENPAELGLETGRSHYVGSWRGQAVFAAPVIGGEAPAGMRFSGLRRLYLQDDETGLAIAGRASQIVAWDVNNTFCGRCGAEMEFSANGERSKICPACGLTKFTRLSPAVIVLVSRGEEMLLARSPRFPEGLFSTIAGFVEPGETLEEAVAREIKEEVGVAVENVRYFGSQPWPFPDSLMVGFTADWAEGDIKIDGREIVAADWFRRDNPPGLPGGLSIARQLIDSFLNGGPTRP